MGKSCEVILEKILENTIIMWHQTTSCRISLWRKYYTYHQNNEHNTSHYMDLKHKIQDHIDDELIKIKNTNESSSEDSTLRKD